MKGRSMLLPLILPSIVAVIGALLAVTRRETVHGLLCLVASLLSVALLMFELGAPLAAALQVIVYAGAVVVLVVFVSVMVGRHAGGSLSRTALGAGVLSLLLLIEIRWLLFHRPAPLTEPLGSGPVPAGRALFGPYAVGVEIASMILLAGMVGAWQVGRSGPSEDGGSRP